MRQLILKLQRVTDPAADRSSCLQLQSPLLMGKRARTSTVALVLMNLKETEAGGDPRIAVTPMSPNDVPKGYLPIYVGMKELRRFVINASFLNHPIFAELLQSAHEYGYEQKGGLKISCDVMLFEHIIFLFNNQS